MLINQILKSLNLFLSVIVIALLSGLSVVSGLSNSKYSNQQPVVNNYSTVNKSSNSINSQTGLSASEATICKTKQSIINQITTKIVSSEQNQLSVMTSLTLRIESLYNQKSKPVTNYSQLIYQIGLNQTKAYSDFTSLSSTSVFSCSSNNPKLALINFQTYLKNEINDLVSFRTSINNLILVITKVNNISIKG